MDINVAGASSFMAAHARLLDRRRFELVIGTGRPQDALSALSAYRNEDGGFGWGLEPDLRSPESQPAAALHAFEVLAETGPEAGAVEMAGRLCDWLAEVSLPDGGLPFALPLTEPHGSATWWASADPGRSSLRLTCAVAEIAHRVARHSPGVRGHAWLSRATDHCQDRIRALTRPAGTLELRSVLGFLDAIHDVVRGAAAELQRLGEFVPAEGVLAVEGGADGRMLRPLDFTPHPDRPLRRLLAPEVIEADLGRLAGRQRDDGGWEIDFASATEAGALEWRGHATVAAVKTLWAHQKTP